MGKKLKRRTKRSPKQVSKRAYNGKSRSQKSRLVQATIISTYVMLLAEARGDDVNIDEIATRSGISERTIYRLFNDKATLGQATDDYMHSYLIASAEQIAQRDVPGFAEYIFNQFEQNENLVVAYLYSRFGLAARAGFRKKFNHLIMTKILREKNLTPTPEREEKLAVIVSLINAKVWHDMRVDFNFAPGATGRAVGAAIASLIEQL